MNSLLLGVADSAIVSETDIIAYVLFFSSVQARYHYKPNLTHAHTQQKQQCEENNSVFSV